MMPPLQEETAMLLKQLFDPQTSTYTYLLADTEVGEAVIIDPVLRWLERDLKLIEELGLQLVYALDTHVHADHITGAGELRRRTGALTAVSAQAEVACADRQLEHLDTLRFGRFVIQVRSTPGHTSGCMTFVVETEERTLAFTGDTLFIRGCGRTDFQQGDAATLYRSVHEQIFSLPPDTLIYPGHDYRGHTVSTVGEELDHNPRLRREVTEPDFLAIMDGLDLAHPRRIHEALPANLGCGLLEESAAASPPERPFADLLPRDLSIPPSGMIVDVRSAAEFHGELGHLPDAVLAPLTELAERADSWARDEPVLVVCRSGRRSAEGCSILAGMGFTKVTNLSGGMTAWREREATC